MLSRFDLLLKLRARNLDEMRDILVNKVRKFPQNREIELMTTLKTIKRRTNYRLIPPERVLKPIIIFYC